MTNSSILQPEDYEALFNAFRELFEAAKAGLDVLENMAPQDFAKGCDKPARLKLQGAIGKIELYAKLYGAWQGQANAKEKDLEV